MSWIAWVLIGWLALSSLVAIGTIGKPREPLTPGVVIAVIIINAGQAIAILALAGAL